MVANVLGHALALVDDDTLLGRLSDGVLGARRERGELGLVLVGSDVALADLGRRDDVLALDLGLVLRVEDGLDVVLNVVDCEEERAASA